MEIAVELHGARLLGEHINQQNQAFGSDVTASLTAFAPTQTPFLSQITSPPCLLLMRGSVLALFALALLLHKFCL